MAEIEETPMAEEPQEEGKPTGFAAMQQMDRESRPFPGQHMMDRNPSYPHNRPPEFTNLEEAQEDMFDKLTAGSDAVIKGLHQGMTVEVIADMILMSGYGDGKWNHNLMMLMAEPVIYTILFIAEVAGVDYVLYDGDGEEMISPDNAMASENHLTSISQKTLKKVEKEVEEEGAEDSIADALPASLLERGV